MQDVKEIDTEKGKKTGVKFVLINGFVNEGRHGSGAFAPHMIHQNHRGANAERPGRDQFNLAGLYYSYLFIISITILE